MAVTAERFVDVVDHAHDGCQWNPMKGRGALPSDKHFRRTTAAVIVGGRGDGAIRYRLCQDCANLPLFRRRVRRVVGEGERKPATRRAVTRC